MILLTTTEPTKRQRAAVQILQKNTLQAFLRAFNCQRYKISVFTIKSNFTPIERTRKAYIKPYQFRQKGRNNQFRPQKQQTAQDQGKFLYQFSVILYHFSALKNLWGVCPKSNFSKIQKSLTGVILKIKFFKKFFQKNLPGVCPKIH